ncbi:hypothetical protein HpBT153_07710 [Helicobacter pylori]
MSLGFVWMEMIFSIKARLFCVGCLTPKSPTESLLFLPKKGENGGLIQLLRLKNRP